MALLDLRT